jgi:hypothetical protein
MDAIRALIFTLPFAFVGTGVPEPVFMPLYIVEVEAIVVFLSARLIQPRFVRKAS